MSWLSVFNISFWFKYLIFTNHGNPGVTRYGPSRTTPLCPITPQASNLCPTRITLIIWNPSRVTENTFATLNRQLNCLPWLISIQARVFMWIWTIWFNFMDKILRIHLLLLPSTRSTGQLIPCVKSVECSWTSNQKTSSTIPYRQGNRLENANLASYCF